MPLVIRKIEQGKLLLLLNLFGGDISWTELSPNFYFNLGEQIQDEVAVFTTLVSVEHIW